MYIKCSSCNSVINVNRANTYICPRCRTSNEAIIGEFYSNVYPITYSISISFASIPFILIACFLGYIKSGTGFQLYIAILALLFLYESFALGVARTLMGVFYRKDSPTMVLSFGFIMLILITVLSVNVVL